MKTIETYDERTIKVWQKFVIDEQLSAEQQERFLIYLDFLLLWTERINLTAIVQPHNIITYHFQDSLQLQRFADMATVRTICDVGCGAGFPGIPLAIAYPDTHMILMEVNNKKIIFLQELVHMLKMDNLQVYTHDWRTFLRTTDYPVDYFVTRASLPMEELMRMFKPGCVYKHKQLVYWASKEWEPETAEQPFLSRQEWYNVGYKRRKLVFFKLPE